MSALTVGARSLTRFRAAESREGRIVADLPPRVLLGRLRLEFERDEPFVSDDPSIVARLDHVGSAGADLTLGTVFMHDVQPARLDHTYMAGLAAVCSGHRLHVI